MIILYVTRMHTIPVELFQGTEISKKWNKEENGRRNAIFYFLWNSRLLTTEQGYDTEGCEIGARSLSHIVVFPYFQLRRVFMGCHGEENKT